MEPRDVAIYPGFDVYKAIVDWLEAQRTHGKVLDTDLAAVDPRLITRGDVGALNNAIRAAVIEHNEHLRFR